MTILNWICFILVCLDTAAYLMDKARNENSHFAGVLLGLTARVYVLYNTATYWLLV